MIQRDERRCAADVMVYWWETSSDQPIACPLDLSHRKELQVGDIFLHRSPRKLQLWLWLAEGGGLPVWKPVHVGYRRTDGRTLTLTEVHQKPSWLDPDWFAKHRKQREFYVLIDRTPC